MQSKSEPCRFVREEHCRQRGSTEKDIYVDCAWHDVNTDVSGEDEQGDKQQMRSVECQTKSCNSL
jgi:hypothetical protein